MSRRDTVVDVEDTAIGTPVRVLTETGTESEIRFDAAPLLRGHPSDTAAPATDGDGTNRAPSLRDRTFRLRRTAVDILVFSLIVVAAFAIWPVRLGGGTSYIIIEGTSMEPKFHTGDLAVLRSQDSYRKGDIVAYRIPARSAGAGHLVIHRIIGRSHGGYLMQGDNRTTPDTWYPKAPDVLGKFRLLVPLPGIQFWALMPWICCAAIGTAVAWMMWPRRADADPTQPDESPGSPDSVGAASTTAVEAGPVPIGARRLRRLERDARAREQHPHPHRRATGGSKQPAAT